MTTPTLTEFLLARIAEDEAGPGSARALPRDYPWGNIVIIGNRVWADPDRYPHRDITDEYTKWIATLPLAPSTARVLAECEKNRRILALHSLDPDPEPDDDWLGSCRTCTTGGPDAQGWPCDTLKALALPYSDHPDFREGWRP